MSSLSNFRPSRRSPGRARVANVLGQQLDMHNDPDGHFRHLRQAWELVAVAELSPTPIKHPFPASVITPQTTVSDTKEL